MHHLEIEDQEHREAAIKRRIDKVRDERAGDAMAALRRHELTVGPAVDERAVDWSQAPEWANYWAMDNDCGIGIAFWHAARPRLNCDDREWQSRGRAKWAPGFGFSPQNWTSSLVERDVENRRKAEAAIKDRFTTADAVEHPAHYTQGGIECIEVLEQLAADGHDFRILNAIKYLWRYRHKGGNESLRKAVWYIDRVLSDSEKEADHG